MAKIVSIQQVASHPANISVISYISRFNSPAELEMDWDEMQRRSWSIGTLPEVVDLLWIHFAEKLPKACRAIFMNRPVLLNPDSGDIFGFATGTYTPMVKLKGEPLTRIRHSIGESNLAQMDQTYGDINDVGSDWVYCSSSLANVSDIFFEAYMLTCKI